jgi:hypothetical protein
MIKPDTVADYNRHKGYVDKGQSIANSYSISHRTWKWAKKAVFPSVTSDHSEQLHPSFFIQRFQTHYHKQMDTVDLTHVPWDVKAPKKEIPHNKQWRMNNLSLTYCT